MEKLIMKQKFYECVLKKPPKSNSFLISSEKYRRLIEEVRKAKNGKKETRHYWLLRHYDILNANERDYLIYPIVGDSCNVLYYVTSEELFDVLYETHHQIGHRGRDGMKKQLNLRYKNITCLEIQTFLNLCGTCQQNKKSGRKPRDIPDILGMP